MPGPGTSGPPGRETTPRSSAPCGHCNCPLPVSLRSCSFAGEKCIIAPTCSSRPLVVTFSGLYCGSSFRLSSEPPALPVTVSSGVDRPRCSGWLPPPVVSGGVCSGCWRASGVADSISTDLLWYQRPLADLDIGRVVSRLSCANNTRSGASGSHGPEDNGRKKCANARCGHGGTFGSCCNDYAPGIGRRPRFLVLNPSGTYKLRLTQVLTERCSIDIGAHFERRYEQTPRGTSPTLTTAHILRPSRSPPTIRQKTYVKILPGSLELQ